MLSLLYKNLYEANQVQFPLIHSSLKSGAVPDEPVEVRLQLRLPLLGHRRRHVAEEAAVGEEERLHRLGPVPVNFSSSQE